MSRKNNRNLSSNVVKAEPEGEPKGARGHGSRGQIGKTNGRTDEIIINEKLSYI